MTVGFQDIAGYFLDMDQPMTERHLEEIEVDCSGDCGNYHHGIDGHFSLKIYLYGTKIVDLYDNISYYNDRSATEYRTANEILNYLKERNDSIPEDARFSFAKESYNRGRNKIGFVYWTTTDYEEIDHES